MLVEYVVIGRPAPQGSKRPVGNGRMVEMSKYLPAWRAAIVDQVRNQQLMFRYPRLDSALSIELAFFLDRPKGVTEKHRLYPVVMPDLDKLTRAANDALKIAGAIADDCIIVRSTQTKLYADHQIGILTGNRPGLVATIQSIDKGESIWDDESKLSTCMRKFLSSAAAKIKTGCGHEPG